MKRIDVLLAAFASARRYRPELRLVLAGCGSRGYESKVRSMIENRELQGAVELRGLVEGDQKEALLTGSSLFVLPSARENFGVAAVEAMDAGLPVVLSHEVGVWPLVERYGAGRVVPPIPDVMVDAMIRILNEPAQAVDMGRAGQRLVRENFAPGVIGPQIVGLYRQVATAGIPGHS